MMARSQLSPTDNQRLDDVGLVDSLLWTEEESLERLKRFYVDGRLSFEEFEWSVGQALRNRKPRLRGVIA